VPRWRRPNEPKGVANVGGRFCNRYLASRRISKSRLKNNLGISISPTALRLLAQSCHCASRDYPGHPVPSRPLRQRRYVSSLRRKGGRKGVGRNPSRH
jgi:hypothetical protein